MSNLTASELALFAEGTKDPDKRAGSIDHLGRMFSRYLQGSLSGVCMTCNNLRPTGHEESLGNRRGFWDASLDNAALAARDVAGKVPSLQLDEISLKDIMGPRLRNEKGEPLSTCRYCAFVCDVLDAVFPRFAGMGMLSYASLRLKKVGLTICEGRPLIIWCRGLEFDPSWAHARVDIEVYPKTTKASEQAHGDLPTAGPARPIPESSDSEESLAFMRQALEDCNKNHTACQTISQAEDEIFVPTRLIYIGQDEIRLCTESIGMPAWVAMSHCWGGSTIINLTNATRAAFEKAIAWEDLPATFQNAVTVARQLDFHYIWIDSLCIVQDDPADWEREAAMMGDVYGHAKLVLGAGSSPDPHTPFLRPRAEEWAAKDVEFHPKEGEPVTYMVRRRAVLAARLDQGLKEPPYTSDWATLRRPGPLYQRAWAFQEAYLAPRILHFTPGSLIYECKTHRMLEGSLPPYPSTAEDTLGELTLARKWQMCVKAYTYRRLTFPKDKLTAIGGIATRFQKLNGYQYIAGLWSENLLNDLLWHAMPGAENQGLAYATDDNSLPSFSWGSIDRGVVWTGYRGITHLAKLLGAHVNRKSENVFGDVSTGFILITGRLLRCRVRFDPGANEYLAYYHRPDGTKSAEQWFPSDGMLIATGSRDVASGTVSNQGIRRANIGETRTWRNFDTEASFLCVAKTAKLDFDHIGLVAHHRKEIVIGDWKTYERVGAISNLPEAWYNHAEEIGEKGIVLA
ncbi:hypothetical protein LTR78_002247 [Recurvomyces mirabilis]|uniref:Heterokaryon incompatibility domain-containing protein n=1 Tax=Recurvomyces mirabilis TaxID=574656 RepID=A0AAE1C4V2_9PEZI|nr:hypothetical protein LTR78_002247 [Recurvomyces mirabilis]KAK5160702.1 hypothetical protein LTS14_001715 [Recurvomyces mirabilis]